MVNKNENNPQDNIKENPQAGSGQEDVAEADSQQQKGNDANESASQKESPEQQKKESVQEGQKPEGQTKDKPEGKGAKRWKQPQESEFVEKVLSIKRVTKVTKGGKKLSFSALVVVGDAKGKVGYSLSKAGEVAIAIRKSLASAKKNMITIPLKGTTIPHEIIGVCGGAEVLLKPASEGTGVIASGPVRAVCDGAGIHNILTKCHRSNNPINVVKATFDGFSRLKAKKTMAEAEI